MLQMLTRNQKSFFDTFGYLHMPGLFNDKITAICSEFESLWNKYGGGHAGRPHDGRHRSCMFHFVDRSELFSNLLDDPRIHGTAIDLCGEDFNYWGSDGNYYAGDTNWHSDGENRIALHVKFAFYLDPLTRDTGALRVIPGSHRFGEGFADGLSQSMANGNFGLSAYEIPSVALETKPGDLVLFNSNIKHAALGGSARRRMFTMVCTQRYPQEYEGKLREAFMSNQKWHLEQRMIDSLSSPYGECMLRTAGPQRRRHLEQISRLVEGEVLEKLSLEVAGARK